MNRIAVVVSDNSFGVGQRPWIFAVGLINSKDPSCYDVKDCAISAIQKVFENSDIDILDAQCGSQSIRIRVFTKDRLSFYDTSFHYKTVHPVVDFDRRSD